MKNFNGRWLAYIFLSSAIFSSNYALAQKTNTLPTEQVAPTKAKDPTRFGFLVLGIGAAPYFKGTDKYTAIPFIAGSYRTGSTHITSRGLGADINLNANQRFAYGPIVHYRTKVKSSKASGRASLLDDKKGAAELGAFVGYSLLRDAHGQDRLNLRLAGMHDVSNAHEGFLVSARAGYALVRSRPLSLGVNLKTTWADSNFQNTYYGVNADEAEQSGLAQFTPSSGFRDVTMGITANHQVNAKFGLMFHLSVSHFIGRSADSPIIEEASKTTAISGLAGTWIF